MDKNEKMVRRLELNAKLGRAALRNPHQYEVPELAKQNIEFLCTELEAAIAHIRAAA